MQRGFIILAYLTQLSCLTATQKQKGSHTWTLPLRPLATGSVTPQMESGREACVYAPRVFIAHSESQKKPQQKFGGERGENKRQVAVQCVSFCCWNVLISCKPLSFILLLFSFLFFLFLLRFLFWHFAIVCSAVRRQASGTLQWRECKDMHSLSSSGVFSGKTSGGDTAAH